MPIKLKAHIAILDIAGHLILWLLVILVTLGLAAFLFPYSFSKFIINRTSIVDPKTGSERQMVCDINIFSDLGHVILWFFISILTLGIGYIFYFYRVWNYALNNSVIK